ncbi:MAG: hypothetical protein ACLUIX_05610 [Oscillospiraceae bacterium]
MTRRHPAADGRSHGPPPPVSAAGVSQRRRTFKRPEGYFAGTLIEQTGLKGLTVGGAQVSTKHAGFVINVGGATSADVEELIRQVQQAVYAPTACIGAGGADRPLRKERAWKF